jgi:phosphoserine phosphatase
MSKEIFLVRHGETQWNIEHRIQGHGNSPLTENGKLQAESLAVYFQKHNIGFDCAYSSTSGRAYNTAKIILKNQKLSIIKRDTLKEINLQAWEGKTKKEVDDLYYEQSMNFWKKPHLYTPVAGENFYQVQDRSVSELNWLLKESNNSKILVVSHAAFIKTIIAFLDKREMKDLWKPPHMKNCCCFVVKGSDIHNCVIHKKIYGDND